MMVRTRCAACSRWPSITATRARRATTSRQRTRRRERRWRSSASCRRTCWKARAYPFSLLHVQLAQQATGAGTTFLRWRNLDRSSMGVALWEALLANPATPASLIDELYAIELQRIVLNMQISLTHSIARQALECANKAAQAEAAYLRRVHGHTASVPPTTKESP